MYRTTERIIGDVPAFLAERRTAGRSYNRIAQDLQDLNVIVSFETIRAWCLQLGIEAPAAEAAS